MQDYSTAGYYKYIDNDLIYGLNIYSAEYFLSEDTYVDNTYPIDGWYWFDSKDIAERFFGII